jgi:SnoaL-like domain
MDDALRYLIEKDAIIGTIDRLFVSTDNRDWEAVKACLAPRVHFDMTSLAGGEPADLTPEEIAGTWEKGLAPVKAVHHQAGNYRVTLDGDRADAFCYGIAFHYLPNDSGRNTRTFVGSYDFHLEKDGSAWRIHRFRFNLKFLDGNLNLESA